MEIVRDAFGTPLPEHLAQPFRGRKRLLELVRDLDNFKLRASGMTDQDYAAHIDYDEVYGLVELVKATILRGAPFTVCPCQSPLHCNLCKGRGWITVTQATESGLLRPSEDGLGRSQVLSRQTAKP